MTKQLLIAAAVVTLSACSTPGTYSKWEPCSVATGPQPTTPGGGTFIPQRAPCGVLTDVLLVDGTVLPPTISLAGGASE